MANRPSDPDTDVRPTTDRAPRAPRWVKVFGILAAVLVLLIVTMRFMGGEHGPGQHTSSGDAGGQVAPSSVMEDRAPSGDDGGGHAPPEGEH